MPAPALSAKHLHVALGGAEILRGLSFEVPTARWTGLVGPNGSGKTTLLRAVAGLLSYRGELGVLGREARGWQPAERARRVAFVRQAAHVPFDLTTEALVLLGRTPHKGWLEGYSREDRDRARAALERVGLAAFARRGVRELSGGERQRALLAQVLVQEADLLLLDEPTAHLDVHYQYAFLDLCQSLVDEGRTVLAVHHDLNQAARYADHLLVLQEGTLHAHGTPADVLTSRLLADVFRMQADVAAPSGTPRITYRAPLAVTET